MLWCRPSCDVSVLGIIRSCCKEGFSWVWPLGFFTDGARWQPLTCCVWGSLHRPDLSCCWELCLTCQKRLIFEHQCYQATMVGCLPPCFWLRKSFNNAASHSRGQLGGTTLVSGIACACPGEGISFLLPRDAGTWVSEPGPHRALEAPGEGILWAGERLLGPVVGCPWGWWPSVPWLQSLRGDKLAWLRCTPGDTRVYIEMKTKLPPHSTCSWTCVCSENSYSSLWPYRQPWGRLEVCRESWAWEEFSVHTGLDKDSVRVKRFLFVVTEVLWLKWTLFCVRTPQKADRGTRQDLCAFPGWFVLM